MAALVSPSARMNRSESRPRHPSEIVQQIPRGSLRGMRVMFINMPLRESAKPNTPPQGPGLMAARLRSEFGAEPSIVDLNAYRIKDEDAAARNLPHGRHLTLREARELIEKHISFHGEPDVVAFSGMITTLRWQKVIATLMREILPDVFLVSGGGLATEIKKALFTSIPELDTISHSEGDDVIVLITNDVKSTRHLPAARRNASFSPSGGYVVETDGRRKFVYEGNRPARLDGLPFAAWDLLERDALGNPVLEWYIETPVWGMEANNSSATPFTMRRSLTTVSSRGCPYACAFCYRGAQGERFYGMRSPEDLAKEVSWLKERYDIDFVGFPDDNFGVSVDRISLLPKTLGPLKVRWGTHTRLDEADERLKDMAEAGCIYIGFGAGSARPPVLTAMNKGGFIP